MDAIEVTVAMPLEQAEEAVRAALADQGFGVLTEVDVAATLRAKLGVERPPLKILGACNPGLANRALELDPAVSLVLPCNVVLQPSGTGTTVSAADPRSVMDDPVLAPLAEEAAHRLSTALHEVASVG